MTLRGRSPLFWILVVAGLLRLAGLFWGLPGSDGWDDDGFAPRNFLTAMALTYKPGAYFTYPPLHAFILGLLTAPGWLWALWHAHSWSQADVVRAFIQVPVMTFFSVVARLLNGVMSLGLIAAVAAMADLIAGARAAWIAAAVLTLNMVLTYYSQVSNLEVAYLFWSMLSLLWIMRAIAWRQPRQFAGAALFAAAAIATKDQAYAIFLFSLPGILLVWFAADAWSRANARKILGTLLLWGVIAAFAVALLDGAITNPTGFAHRAAFLAGAASRDYAAYAATLPGRLALLADMGAYFTHGFAAVGTFLAALGLLSHLSRAGQNGPLGVAGLLPFLAMLSFTIGFNMVALRVEDRFLLPQAILAAVYIGVAADRILVAPYPGLSRAARLALGLAGLYALYLCSAVIAAFVLDPRYDAEHWTQAHLAQGDTVEVYGQNAYLPRFPETASVWRVAQTPLSIRNPLPGVTELREPFNAPRNPRFIIVSDWWVGHYLVPDPAPKFQAQYEDVAARRYFTALMSGQGGYRLAHVSAYAGKLFPPVHIHESLDQTIRIFERR